MTRTQCTICLFLFLNFLLFFFLAVRFGRVPKHEKVRMAEELARVTVRTQTDAIHRALTDSDFVLKSCFTGFVRLIDNVKKLLEKSPTQSVCPVGRLGILHLFSMFLLM